MLWQSVGKLFYPKKKQNCGSPEEKKSYSNMKDKRKVRFLQKLYKCYQEL